MFDFPIIEFKDKNINQEIRKNKESFLDIDQFKNYTINHNGKPIFEGSEKELLIKLKNED